ncbi:MAG: hypothetical protein JWO32_2377 [Bacteroidetes bacterium]|nr:hypothetical protein [Bacteroidota bacterium]
MIRLALLFSILFSCWAQAQSGAIKENQIDSLTLKLRKDSAHIYRFQKVRPYLSIDNRNSFINNQPVNFKGLQVGVILHERHTLALGLYGMSQKSKRSVLTKDGNLAVERTLSLNYLTLFYKYSLIEKRYFELGLPFEIGLGGYDIKFQDTVNGKVYKELKGGIIPFGVGIEPIVKPFRWVGISFLLGYRFVASHSVANFNGMYYSVGLNFDVRQIIRDVNYYGFKKKRYKKNVRAILKQ